MEFIDKYAKLLLWLVALIAYAVVGAVGYHHGLTVAQAQGDAALAKLQAQHAQASVSALSGTFQGYVANVSRGQQAEAQFVLTVAASDAQKSNLKGGIDAVTQPQPVSQSASGDHVVYRCVFSNGFVRLWNAAAGLDAGHGGLPDSAAVPDVEHDPAADAAADSGVSQGDLLEWFVDYSNRSRRVEGQLKSIVAAYPSAE